MLVCLFFNIVCCLEDRVFSRVGGEPLLTPFELTWVFHVAGVAENRLSIVVVGKRTKLGVLRNDRFVYMALEDFHVERPVRLVGWW